jgi:hypothetical protein
MSKFKVGNPWKTGKTNTERKGIWATIPSEDVLSGLIED